MVQNTADGLIAMVKKYGKAPAKNAKATFVSDGNDQYHVLKNFDADTINYGQLVKERQVV